MTGDQRCRETNLEIAAASWDLGDLYPSPTSEELERDLALASAFTTEFARQYKGRVAELDGVGLAAAIDAYATISGLLGKAAAYAQLYRAENATDPESARRTESIVQRVSGIFIDALFFETELSRADRRDLMKILEGAGVGYLTPWIDSIAADSGHKMRDDVEALLREKEETSTRPLRRLFEETINGLTVELAGKTIPFDLAIDLFNSPEEVVRMIAARQTASTLRPYLGRLTLIFNTLLKDNLITASWRNFSSPVMARHAANGIDSADVEALVETVESSHTKLAHRYYKLKSRLLHKPRLRIHDRCALLPELAAVKIPFSKAADVIVDSLSSFSPQFGEIARRFFEGRWVNAAMSPGKSRGAFCHPCVPSVHPYIMVNYQGSVIDVINLAHEIGHGIHQTLAASQGVLMAGVPLPLAETASIFCEMIVFETLERRQKSPGVRKALLAAKIDEFMEYSVRQVSFYRFECLAHEARKQGELTADELGGLWRGVLADSLGPAFEFDEDSDIAWCSIPHFFHAPFYSYSYAFGAISGVSLFSKYKSGMCGFETSYTNLLSAGGTLPYFKALSCFGFAAGQRDFWDRGLDAVSGMIDMLERNPI